MGQGRVLVVGSINVDLVVSVDRLPAPGETVAGGTFARHGGGKSANQAVAATRLGGEAILVGAVGEDDLGRDALAELAREGVDVARVARLPGVSTGVAGIVVDAAGENQIAVASGANGQLDGARVRAALADVPWAEVGCVVLALEVPDEGVLAAARAAAEAGRPIVLNPAPARQLPPDLLAVGPVLTPNRAEALALARAAGAATDARPPDAAARALHGRTGAPVVVTCGAEGVLVLVGDAQAERVPALAVEAVDTTGAGDTFSGALAAELARGAEVLGAARFAVVAAALSTRAAGARSAMPRREEVEAARAAARA